MQLLQCIVVFLWHLQLLRFCNFLSSFHGHGNFDGSSFHFHGLLSFRFVLSRWICVFHGLLSFRFVHCIFDCSDLISLLCSALLCHMRGEECKCCFQFNSRFPSTSTVRKHQLIIRMDSFFFF